MGEVEGENILISPKKRAPRNAKNKRGRVEVPVELGNEYEVDITEICGNGEGLARIKGFPIFVPSTKLGEKVTIKITRLDSVSADSVKVA